MDFTLNIDAVKRQIATLLSGSCTWLTPKEFTMALTHLYHHLKESMLKKKAPAVSAQDTIEKKEVDVAELMKSCYTYKMTQAGDRPQLDGNDLSNNEITKFADLYVAVMQKSKMTIGKSIIEGFRKTGEEPVAETVPAEGTE